MLTPGRFEVLVQAEGYEPETKTVNVTNEDHKEAKIVDFALHAIEPQVDMEQNYANQVLPVTFRLSCKFCRISLHERFVAFLNKNDKF